MRHTDWAWGRRGLRRAITEAIAAAAESGRTGADIRAECQTENRRDLLVVGHAESLAARLPQ